MRHQSRFLLLSRHGARPVARCHPPAPGIYCFLQQANDLQREAVAASVAGGGEALLGLRPDAY
ncbi:MAG TPA: hypothetical protein VI431_02075 [Candidatus Acidoferrum sp.]